MQHRSLYELLSHVCESFPNHVAYRHKRDGQWIDVTWSEYGANVERLARGLLATGLERGDRVCVLAQTRMEWMVADAAIVSAGGATVGIYSSSVARECHYILEHSAARILIVENAEQLEKVLPAMHDLPALETIVIMDGDPASGEALTWNEVLARGEGVGAERVREVGKSLGEQDLAAMVYTSGTTGVPKGVMLTHGNLVFTTWSAAQCLPVRPDYVTLVFLPLAHVFARMIVWLCMRERIAVAFAESLAKVPDNLLEIRPHFITSVPRIFEKARERVYARVSQARGLERKLFGWALAVGERASVRERAGARIGLLLRAERALADRLVLRKIRAAFGGRMIFAISGAAPLSTTVAEFFHTCGVLILEGIGMTENTSFSNVNRLERNKFGTVGPVGPGIEMRIAPDGEVLFRGKNVMAGYLEDPEATAEAIDTDGWLHSGDLGAIDEDGYLEITGRKKDLIVTAGGKNVAPQRLEQLMSASKFISHAVAYGDTRKYVTALVTLEPGHIREWARAQGLGSASLEELAQHPAVNDLIHAEISACNRELAPFESIKKFRILPRDFSIETGELTPTLKVKRKVVYAHYAQMLAEMYD